MQTSEPLSVSVQGSVGEALRFVRMEWRTVTLIGALGAAATASLSMAEIGLGQSQAALDSIIALFAWVVIAAVYAALIGKALKPMSGFASLPSDTLRLCGAMLVVGFFLVLASFALLLPCAFVLQPFMGPYLPDIQAARGDQSALMAIFVRFANQYPALMLALVALICTVMMLLTSRFYVSGPATLDSQRISAFRTWPWTKHNMLRIVWARIMLLGPALVFTQTVSLLFARALGLSTLDAAQLQSFAEANSVVYGVYVFISEFIIICCYTALEAGLAASLYRALKPAA